MEHALRLFPEDQDIILYETSFENDKLGRVRLSRQLSELIEKLENPSVLALDDHWGSGKSFFLKRWVAAHKKENEGTATTVYFDAFENDYLSEPLVSLISAIGERIPEAQQGSLARLKEVGAKLVKPAFGVALSMATFGAKQYLDEMGDAFADAFNGEAKDLANGLWSAEADRKSAFQIFRSQLSHLTDGDFPPLVIVVDELDRCRPDYALSVLEIIKHFFSVPKVHFILGINRESLENSVKARYGADINAEKYLRKFIHVSFSLPNIVDSHVGTGTLATYARDESKRMSLPQDVSNRCIDLTSFTSRRHNVSLRDMGKILSMIALLPAEASDPNNFRGHKDILSVLLVSSIIAPNFHKRFIAGEVSLGEITSFIGSTDGELSERIGDQPNDQYNDEVAIWVAEMIYCTSPEGLDGMKFRSEIKAGIGEAFGGAFRMGDRRQIPRKLQRDWVDIFRT
ncbi:P-loop NTPase fold protein [Pseudooceanicola nitratireducens]|uniref:KAP family P-loop NTPase fold protein n=1 Tax=Pseudooceanicola nitratireducens TaxID=517719 RepID=UPI003108AC40